MYDCIVPLPVTLYIKLCVTFAIYKMFEKHFRSLIKDLMGIMKLHFAILKSMVIAIF